jgi:hypothetical protein
MLWRLGWTLGEKQEKGLGQFSAIIFDEYAVVMYIKLVLYPEWRNVEMFVSGDVSCIMFAGGICVVKKGKDMSKSWRRQLLHQA